MALIGGAGAAAPAEPFSSCVCRAFCRLCAMQRAVLLTYEDGARPFRPVGRHGSPFAPALLDALGGSLGHESALRRALLEDEAQQIGHVDASAGNELLGLEPGQTLTCVPLIAAGQWFGVIVADRGDEPYALTLEELRTASTFGKLAALASGTRIATREQEHARRLGERSALADEMQSRVGDPISRALAALESEADRPEPGWERCRHEMRDALDGVRGAVERAEPQRPATTGAAARLPSSNGIPPGTEPELLSRRQIAILELVARGHTNREIAESLYLSPHTIKEHVHTICQKLEARNRAAAVQRAQRLGVLS